MPSPRPRCSSMSSGKPFLTFPRLNPYLLRTPPAPRANGTQACPYSSPSFFSSSLVSRPRLRGRNSLTSVGSPFPRHAAHSTWHSLWRDDLFSPRKATVCPGEDTASLGRCPNPASRQPTWSVITTNFSHKAETPSHALHSKMLSLHQEEVRSFDSFLRSLSAFMLSVFLFLQSN